MPMTEDLSVFLDAAEHATTALLDGDEVAGIFDNDFLEVDGLATRTPMFTLAEASLGSAGRGSTLVINGATYRVRTPERDGTGMVTLPLEKQ